MLKWKALSNTMKLTFKGSVKLYFFH